MIKQRKNIVKYSQKLKAGHFKPNFERGGVNEFKYIKRAVFVSDFQVLRMKREKGSVSFLLSTFAEDPFKLAS